MCVDGQEYGKLIIYITVPLHIPVRALIASGKLSFFTSHPFGFLHCAVSFGRTYLAFTSPLPLRRRATDISKAAISGQNTNKQTNKQTTNF